MENNQYFYTPTFSTKTNHPTIFSIMVIFFLIIYLLFKRRRCNQHLFTFKPNPGKMDTLYCAVCLDNVAGGERCRKLPKCNHCFHVDCINVWFETHPTCPLCRSQVHHISKYQKKRSIFSYFLLISQHIVRKLGKLVVDRIAEAFFEDT